VVELVEHGRPGSQYPHDLLIAASGESVTKKWFGEQLGQFLRTV